MIQWTRPAAVEYEMLALQGDNGSDSDEVSGELEPTNAFAEFSYRVGIGVVIALLCMIVVTSLRA